jgi:hypothetical protein
MPNFVWNTGTIQSSSYGIYSNGGSSKRVNVTINGGTISSANCGIYSNSYSSVSLLGGTIRSSSCGIGMSNQSSTVIDGGDIIVENLANTNAEVSGVTGNQSTTVTFNSGNITINRSSSYSTFGGSPNAYGIRNTNTVMNGGNISVTAKTPVSYSASAYGIAIANLNDVKLDINGGTISATNSGNNNSYAYGVYYYGNYRSSSFSISGATIT